MCMRYKVPFGGEIVGFSGGRALALIVRAIKQQLGWKLGRMIVGLDGFDAGQEAANEDGGCLFSHASSASGPDRAKCEVHPFVCA
ncbi:unnamed protein product, partial [Iphiclides podalirius]